MLINIFLMIIISTSLTVPTQPSPRFHVKAWLPFRNREMDYYSVCTAVTKLPLKYQIMSFPKLDGSRVLLTTIK